MNTRERIASVISANKAEKVKNLLDYKLTLVHKRSEIDGKIANVETLLKQLNQQAETKEEGTQIAANDN